MISVSVSSATYQNNTLAEDATVNQAAATTNYASDCFNDPPTCFESNYVASNELAFLVKANSSGVPAGATINSVKVYMYLRYGAAPTLTAYPITSTWAESTVTWNTRPTRGATSIGTKALSGTGYKFIDITNTARGWYNGTITDYGFYVSQTIDDGAIFNSREQSANKPYISWDYTAGSGGGVANTSNATGIAATQNLTGVNTTWSAGTEGSVVTSYNVSVNGAWTNGSSQNWYYAARTDLQYQNVSVWGYNATTRLSLAAVSNNMQYISHTSNPTGISSNHNLTGITTSWSAGTESRKIDTYNVSVNGTWTNGSSATSYFHTRAVGEWQNLTVLGYNATYGLSPASVSDNRQMSAASGITSYTGLRNSEYGCTDFGGSEPCQPTYTNMYINATSQMHAWFPTYAAAQIYVLGYYDTVGNTWLNFPSSGTNIVTETVEGNEASLDAMDAKGQPYWLQVEPGDASITLLMDKVFTNYGPNHTGNIIGFGIDAEWYQPESCTDGCTVTNANAAAWISYLQTNYNSYCVGGTCKMFLKHFNETHLPTNRTAGIVFGNDDEGNGNFATMLSEYDTWINTFSPSETFIQTGYPSDKASIWGAWGSNAPRVIFDNITAGLPDNANFTGFFFVDFSANTANGVFNDTYVSSGVTADVTVCTTIASSGTYTLKNNLATSGGSCIIIAANDVIFNGGGYTITSVSNSGVAVSGSRTGITVTNTNFIDTVGYTSVPMLDAGSASSSNFSYNGFTHVWAGSAISLNGGSYNIIKGNTVSGTNSEPATTKYGFLIQNSNYNTISNNSIAFDGEYSFQFSMLSSSFNTLANNTINNAAYRGYALYLNTGSNNNVLNDNIITNSYVYSARSALAIGSSNNNTVNRGSLTGAGYDYYLYTASNNALIDTVMSAGTVYLYSDSTFAYKNLSTGKTINAVVAATGAYSITGKVFTASGLNFTDTIPATVTYNVTGMNASTRYKTPYDTVTSGSGGYITFTGSTSRAYIITEFPCNWCSGVNVTVYNNGSSKTYSPAGITEGNLSLQFFNGVGANDALTYKLTVDTTTRKEFNHSANNWSTKVTFILSNVLSNANFSIQRYNSTGIMIADQWILSNSTGVIAYNATLFNGSEFTIVSTTTPTNPVTILIGVATIIIGGIIYYLIRVRRI
jgi:hypothetical protein